MPRVTAGRAPKASAKRFKTRVVVAPKLKKKAAAPRVEYVDRPRPSTMSSARNLGYGAVDVASDIIGDKLNAMFSNLRGSGEYREDLTVRKNTLGLAGDSVPFVHSDGIFSTRYRHREYLGDVISSSVAGAFKTDTYTINPGNAKCFPWLNLIAGQNYQKWSPQGIVFEFKSTSGDALNSVNTALGTVIMATNYDSKDAIFLNKATMENTQYSCSCKPSNSMLHPIECDPSIMVLPQMYITSGSESSDSFDARFDNLGKMTIASVGLQGSSVNIGELWVSYDIVLVNPIENRPLSQAKTCRVALDYANVTTSALMGTTNSAKLKLINNMGVTLSGNTVTFPAGTLRNDEQYSLFYNIIGAATASVTSPSFTLSAGLTGRGGYANFNNTFLSWPYASGVTQSQCGIITTFSVNDASSTQAILLACTTIPASLVCVDLIIIQINSSTLGNSHTVGF